MSLTLEQAIARVPMWQGIPGIQSSHLEGGITNHNFRVDVAGESFHVRLAGENTGMLGIDREHEYQAGRSASEAGIAPEVIYFIRPEGYLVSRFITGRHLPPEELRQLDNIRRVVDALHKIHSMPSIPGVFNAFQVVRDYTAIAQRYNVRFPENFDWLVDQMHDAESTLSTHPLSPRPCHNDLLNANFLMADKLYILDWEYAGMGDIFFDLANFSNNHELSEQEYRFLLNCYFGEVTPQTVSHFQIMRIMSDFREAMWGLVQAGISNLDFDFYDYATKHFNRLTQNIQDPDWKRWLADMK
jgi:thiamine kinase-like enzyme